MHGMREADTVRASGRVGRGLSLLSGGLDSMLAVCVLRAQGLGVECVVFASPFFDPGAARQAARQLGVRLHEIDFTEEIVALVEHPPHGFGGTLNPCVDCHAGMIRRAGERMAEMGFDFVATGEVLGQRPMSQNRQSLGVVAASSGFADRLVRPLSALLLEPTLPEREGLIDRSRLLALNGRSRKPQIALAAAYGVTGYPSPAGGCLLTDEGYCRRLADLQAHEGLRDPRLLRLLRVGRHFRLPGGAKCIVGRNRAENDVLHAAACLTDTRLHAAGVPGPVVLVPGGAGGDDLTRAAELCAAFSDRTADGTPVTVAVGFRDREEVLQVAPTPRERFQPWLLASPPPA